MWRTLYIIYAIIVTVATTGINNMAGSGGGSSYRSWGDTGSNYSSGGGGFHK